MSSSTISAACCCKLEELQDERLETALEPKKVEPAMNDARP